MPGPRGEVAGPGRRTPAPTSSRPRASLFAEQGFRRTTIRAVAGAAGVDPALVHHYFGSKDDLFVAALALPVDPRQVIGSALAGGVDGAGERLVRAFLSVWDDPAYRPHLLGLVRGALEPEGHRLLSEGFLPAVVLPAVDALGVDQPERRMALVASQVAGLILLRYVLEAEPLASMEPEAVAAVIGPTIQGYLERPLP